MTLFFKFCFHSVNSSAFSNMCHNTDLNFNNSNQVFGGQMHPALDLHQEALQAECRRFSELK